MVAALSVTERRMHSHWGDSGKRECSSRMHLTLPFSGEQAAIRGEHDSIGGSSTAKAC
jgi:hypothetical protein